MCAKISFCSLKKNCAQILMSITDACTLSLQRPIFNWPLKCAHIFCCLAPGPGMCAGRGAYGSFTCRRCSSTAITGIAGCPHPTPPWAGPGSKGGGRVCVCVGGGHPATFNLSSLSSGLAFALQLVTQSVVACSGYGIRPETVRTLNRRKTRPEQNIHTT